MKSIRLLNLFIISIIFFFGQEVYAKITPLIISEVFYDSPLNENNTLQGEHHNGEFIELFNPTLSDIQLYNWTLRDRTTSYKFPNNTIIPARSYIIVAYRYPNSNFSLTNLFPNIDPVLAQQYILYQNNIMLNNSQELLELIDNNCNIVDKMSYTHKSNFESYNGYWDITARNGDYINNNVESLVSLQRKDIHFTTDGITPTQTDYYTDVPTPLQKTTYSDSYPIFTEPDTDVELPSGSENAVVGTISGEFAVSPTGAATYTIPIECPAGINGMQPNISVGYSSQAGYGALGTGWNISGISAITRGGKNLYNDTNTEGVKFDNTDPLYLDGQRLIQLNSESFGNLCAGAIYGTEVEDYSQVKILADSNNDIYFQITTQDGRTL